MPLGTMTTNNAVKIMTMMGEVLEVENPLVDDQLLRTFLRVRINVDVTKPLPTGCWIPRKDLPKTLVVFKYEKLQDFCYKCGVLGHEQKGCQEERAMAAFRNDYHRYGPSLGVPTPLTLTEIALQRSSWKNRVRPQARAMEKEGSSMASDGETSSHGPGRKHGEDEGLREKEATVQRKQALSAKAILVMGEFGGSSQGGECDVHSKPKENSNDESSRSGERVAEEGAGGGVQGERRKENDMVDGVQSQPPLQCTNVPDIAQQIRETQWWAKEQEDNQVVYLQLQADILALRTEVAEFWSGKREKAPASWGSVDLVSGMIPRRNMGPNQIYHTQDGQASGSADLGLGTIAETRPNAILAPL